MMQKSPPPCVRILVLGAQEVGKSAVTVRFLTQRFIGEYYSLKDLLYCSSTHVTGYQVDVEILDTARDQTDNMSSEKLDWSSAFVVVYSISSRASFLVAADCLRHLPANRGAPVLLLANKKDLEHAREVTTEEGQALSKETGVHFAEVSAAEGFTEVAEAFRQLIADSSALSKQALNNSSPTNTVSRRKISVVSVSRIISAMFGRGGSGTLAVEHHDHKKRPSLSL